MKEESRLSTREEEYAKLKVQEEEYNRELEELSSQIEK